MAFTKKTWADRVAEYINRRILNKTDGTQEVVTVERSEGDVSVEGDAFNAANMNNLEDRIETAFSDTDTEIEALQTKIDTTKTELGTKIDTTKTELGTKIDSLANKVVCLRPDTSKLLQEFNYSLSSSFSVSFTVNTDGFFSGGLYACVTNATDHYVRANFWLNGRPISNYAFSNEKAHRFDVYAFAYIPVKAGDVISMDGGVRAYAWNTQGGVYALKAVEFNI